MSPRFTVTRARPENAAGFAELRFARGWSAVESLRICRDELESNRVSDEHAVFLAWEGERAIGYGRAMKYRRSAHGDLYDAQTPLPDGWYLRGVVVRPEFRRFGIARRLTETRLAWLGERTPQVYCFLDSKEKLAVPMYGKLSFKAIFPQFESGVLLLREEKLPL